ncbi:MAG: AraC family transcriptional regulator [Acidobacteriaceae bacterium]|nr:AraC family transcriptional regulator [Acidobacteriaceae bacterium]
MAEQINVVKLHVDSFNVIGISTRTSNAMEASGNGEIAQLWKRFRNDDVLVRIANRADDRVIAVYSDYQSDRNGMYTYTLGAKVTSTKDVPAGMVVQRVEAGNYAVLESQGQAAGPIVLGLWQRAWSLEDAHELHRAYKTDFDVYYEDLKKSPAAEHVNVYVGLGK